MNTTTPAAVLAMDIFNAVIQREIEAAPEDVALELAKIKFTINQQFDQERR